MMQGTVTSADGVKISYQVEGAENAPWLVLSNSLATDRRMWDGQMETLLASRRVLRYDTRGHGQSETVKGPYTFDQLTNDILALYDALSIERADFMGLSLGGMTGLALAIRAPEKVGKLVCCDARAQAPEPYKAMWDGNIARLHEVGIDGMVDATIPRWFTAPFLEAPENADVLDTVKSMIQSTSSEGYEGVARLLQTLDLQDQLAAMQPETLFIVGESDMAAPVAAMQEMATISGASLTVIPNASHLSSIERPAAFTRAITEFLNL